MNEKQIEELLDLAERFIQAEELKIKLMERSVLAQEANTDSLKVISKVLFDVNQNLVHAIEQQYHAVR